MGLGSLACRVRTLGGNYGYISRKSAEAPVIPETIPTGSIFWFEIPYEVNQDLREQWMSMGHRNEDTSNAHIQSSALSPLEDAGDTKILPFIPIATENSDPTKLISRVRKPSIFNSLFVHHRIGPDLNTTPITESPGITSPRQQMALRLFKSAHKSFDPN